MKLLQWLLNFISKTTPQTKKNFTSREARIKLTPLHHLEFKRTDCTPHQNLEIINISTTGVGFVKKTNQVWPPVGSTIKGIFRFDKVVFPLTLKIAQFSSTVVGCALSPTPDNFKHSLERYFSSELAGARINEVNPSILKEEPDGIPHWFYSNNNCELFFVEQAGNILRFHLCLFGNYVEGGLDQETRFGSIIENDSFDKVEHRASDLIRWDEKTNPDQMIFIERFIQNIPQLSESKKAQLLGFFKTTAQARSS